MRFFIILVMLGSLGTYFYVNSYKVDYLSQVYNEIINGESAPGVELRINSESVFHHRLRSSNFFDASGTRQVSFLGLDPDVYARIAGNIAELKLRVNGNDVPFEAIEKGNAVQLIWADRKINVVRSGDMQVIADNITYENNNRKGMFECFSARFCQSIRISTEGIGPLEGPYLDNDKYKLKRGLPMGRWGYGPSSTISVLSEISTEAVLGINMLRLSEDQEINVEGPILAQKSFPTEKFSAPFGGLQLYPESRRFNISLQPGINEIKFIYSKWTGLNGRDQRFKAVYITSIKIEPITFNKAILPESSKYSLNSYSMIAP